MLQVPIRVSVRLISENLRMKLFLPYQKKKKGMDINLFLILFLLCIN